MVTENHKEIYKKNRWGESYVDPVSTSRPNYVPISKVTNLISKISRNRLSLQLAYHTNNFHIITFEIAMTS